jgi:hypothetical protein
MPKYFETCRKSLLGGLFTETYRSTLYVAPQSMQQGPGDAICSYVPVACLEGLLNSATISRRELNSLNIVHNIIDLQSSHTLK